MILTCELCQSQFLTESDPHVVIPGPETKIYCYCQVKGNEQKLIAMLKHDHNLFQKCLKDLNTEIDRLNIENERLQNYVITGYEEGIKELKAENAKLRECVEFYASGKANQQTEKDFSDIYVCDSGPFSVVGKRARQVLKELDEK